jgi:hypothetical protein
MTGTKRMGRPPRGVDHVDSVEGSERAKERLKCVLLSLTGELTRDAAAQRIGVSGRRLHKLREDALTAAVASLEPSRLGRPPKPRLTAQEQRLRQLESEAELLAWELSVSRTREELALLMPGVTKGGADGSRSAGKARASGSRRPRGATGRSTRRG